MSRKGDIQHSPRGQPTASTWPDFAGESEHDLQVIDVRTLARLFPAYYVARTPLWIAVVEVALRVHKFETVFRLIR